MELRGFGKHDKRTWYTRRPFARRDFIALAVGVVLLLISLTVTMRFRLVRISGSRMLTEFFKRLKNGSLRPSSTPRACCARLMLW